MKARASPPDGLRVVKRYENRKLYDTQSRRYVTLERLAAMVGSGEEVRVVDQRTGDDLTSLMLAQVVLEGVRARTWHIPAQALARLIRLGGRAAGAAWIGPHEAARRAREETERIVGRVLGHLTIEDALSLRQEVSGAVHRIVAEAQHGVETRVRALLDRLEGEKGAHPVLSAVRERLLSPPEHARARPAAPRPAGKKKTTTKTKAPRKTATRRRMQ